MLKPKSAVIDAIVNLRKARLTLFDLRRETEENSEAAVRAWEVIHQVEDSMEKLFVLKDMVEEQPKDSENNLVLCM